METRSQRRERTEGVLSDVDDECIAEPVVEGRSNDSLGNQSQLEETLQMMKEVLKGIENDQKELKESCERVFQENTRLVERVEKLESYKTESRINNSDFETRYDNLEESIGQLASNVKQLSSYVKGEVDAKLQYSSEAISSVRLQFTESFDQLLTAVENLDKHVQSTEVDLQRKMMEISRAYPVGSPEAKSTVVKPTTITSVTKAERRFLSTKLDLDHSQSDKVHKVGQRKPIQAAPKFNGKSSWEVFKVQFDIAAEINGWQENDKAVFLATALEGKAALVLGNLSSSERRDYKVLVSALTTRFGMAHQSELARAKLKCKTKTKEESMPELAEYVETLTRAAYPDASAELQDIMTRDNFIDALPDDDIRLKIRQSRPSSLQAALESAIELESFRLASRHRSRSLRDSSWNVRKVEETKDDSGREVENSSIKRLERMMDALLNELRKNAGYGTPRKLPEQPKCWNCGKPGHLRRQCTDGNKRGSERKGDGLAEVGDGENKNLSKQQGNEPRST
jgi:uncharacterized protein YoxC